jgi:hypothetical protein
VKNFLGAHSGIKGGAGKRLATGARPLISMNKMQVDQTSRVPEREHPRWAYWLCGAGLLAAILLIASALSPWVRHEWSLSLLRQNDPYTQLAFNQAEALPVTVVRGKEIRVSFAITNDEGKPVSYQYVVASGSGAKLAPLSSSSDTVAAGAIWNVDSTVIPKCETNSCRVQVSLPRQGERIDFMFTYQDQNSSKKK